MSWRQREPKKPTGSIWNKPPKERARIVRAVCRRLERAYRLPRLGNPENPIDDLAYIVVSNKTSPSTAARVYASFKSRFATWDEALVADEREFFALLQPAGLATVKTQQLRGALAKIATDFGSVRLDELRSRSEEEATAYLTSLPGVSEKVAKCVMMYTLDFQVLPVDVHVHRVARRLGWTARKRADQSHDELESLVTPVCRYAFHVDCIAHGRAICTPLAPKCPECPIMRYCEYYKTVRMELCARDDDRSE